MYDNNTVLGNFLLSNLIMSCPTMYKNNTLARRFYSGLALTTSPARPAIATGTLKSSMELGILVSTVDPVALTLDIFAFNSIQVKNMISGWTRICRGVFLSSAFEIIAAIVS